MSDPYGPPADLPVPVDPNVPVMPSGPRPDPGVG